MSASGESGGCTGGEYGRPVALERGAAGRFGREGE